MLDHRVVVVHVLGFVADLALLAKTAHHAALLSQAVHQRRKVAVRRCNHHHVGPLGQHEVDGIHRHRDVGAVLASSQVDHRLDAQPLEGRLVGHRALRRAVGAAHMQAAMLVEQQAHRLLHHIQRQVVGIDQQHHTFLAHGQDSCAMNARKNGREGWDASGARLGPAPATSPCPSHFRPAQSKNKGIALTPGASSAFRRHARA